MPNIKAAMKRVRADAKLRAHNQATLSELNTLDKKLRALADKPSDAKIVAQQATSRYDQAVSQGIIPRGRADRKKSRIAKFLAKISKK